MQEPTRFITGEPFPVKVPDQTGPWMTLWEDLTVVNNFPGLTPGELSAFRKGFKQYSYLETDTPVPLALWVFKFPSPHGTLELNFNARIEKSERIARYLKLEAGQVKNGCHFYLVDGQILKGIQLVSLDPEAVTLFHKTIRKQLQTEYSLFEYDKYLQAMYSYNSSELFSMGRVFKKR